MPLPPPKNDAKKPDAAPQVENTGNTPQSAALLPSEQEFIARYTQDLKDSFGSKNARLATRERDPAFFSILDRAWRMYKMPEEPVIIVDSDILNASKSEGAFIFSDEMLKKFPDTPKNNLECIAGHEVGHQFQKHYPKLTDKRIEAIQAAMPEPKYDLLTLLQQRIRDFSDGLGFFSGFANPPNDKVMQGVYRHWKEVDADALGARFCGRDNMANALAYLKEFNQKHAIIPEDKIPKHPPTELRVEMLKKNPYADPGSPMPGIPAKKPSPNGPAK